MRLRALALLALTLASASPAATNKAVDLLHWTRWIDIAPAISLSALTPKQIAALARCKTVSMFFERAGPDGIDQIFYAGLMMQNRYQRLTLSRDGAGTQIALYRDLSAKVPAEMLRLSLDGKALVLTEPPFRPHTYLRCQPR